MSRRPALTLAAGLVSGVMLLAGCTSSGDHEHQPAPSSAASQPGDSGQGGHAGHGGGEMDHPADGGPAPAGITPATSPKYPVGTTVTLTADHMEGMNGATATVVGAFDTVTYAIDYTPTTGGEPVKNHKWVVQEELVDAGEQRLPDGAEATVSAAHMAGMEGAQATIASSTDETVYMVDYQQGGMTMKNHKWVVESELQPAN